MIKELSNRSVKTEWLPLTLQQPLADVLATYVNEETKKS